MSSQEVVFVPKMADVSPEYAEILMLGNVLQKSGYFKDVRDQAQAVTKILFGRELGFSPIVSISGIHVIEGKPALSSNLMATLIKRSGKYDYRVKTWTTGECVLTFREKIGGKWEDVGESSFSMDDARTAGLVRQGGSWSKYPRPMLFARALSQGLRTYCPDVSASPIYVPEEMGAEVNEDGDVTQLPKSARNVEVIEKDIDLGSPVIQAARPEDAVGVGERTQPGPASKASQPDPDAAQDKMIAEIEARERAAELPKPSEGPFIAIGQQKNFHREMRAALKNSMDADAKTYAWLLDNGYYETEAGTKLPTAAKIPQSGWLAIRDKAVAWALKQ